MGRGKEVIRIKEYFIMFGNYVDGLEIILKVMQRKIKSSDGVFDIEYNIR